MTNTPNEAKLIERCAKAVRRRQIERTTSGRGIFDAEVPPTDGELDNVRAVLRESGYAELLAALKPFAEMTFTNSMWDDTRATHETSILYCATDKRQVTLGDFRRAQDVFRRAKLGTWP